MYKSLVRDKLDFLSSFGLKFSAPRVTANMFMNESVRVKSLVFVHSKLIFISFIYLQIELSILVGAGRIKMSIIGQDVLVTRNEVFHTVPALERNHVIN